MGYNLCQNTSDKGLATRICRAVKKLNYPKINDPMNKWANELHRTFSKKEVKMARRNAQYPWS
jgi:hypothetical protein